MTPWSGRLGLFYPSWQPEDCRGPGAALSPGLVQVQAESWEKEPGWKAGIAYKDPNFASSQLKVELKVYSAYNKTRVQFKQFCSNKKLTWME